MSNMQRVKCENCQQVQLVEYVTAHVGHAVPSYCSFCGSSKVTRSFPPPDSYWHDLAEGLGLPRSTESADLVQGVYRLWEPSEYPLFRDWFRSAYESVEETA
jgi:hypothetical protein